MKEDPAIVGFWNGGNPIAMNIIDLCQQRFEEIRLPALQHENCYETSLSRAVIARHWAKKTRHSKMIKYTRNITP